MWVKRMKQMGGTIEWRYSGHPASEEGRGFNDYRRAVSPFNFFSMYFSNFYQK